MDVSDGRRFGYLQCAGRTRSGSQCDEFALERSNYCAACGRRATFRVIGGRPVSVSFPCEWSETPLFEKPKAPEPVSVTDPLSAAAILLVGAWLGAIAAAAFLWWFPR